MLAGALVVGSAGRAFGLDRDLAYLHSLQSHGYGDIAVSYLETLEKTNAVPPGVRDVFDLEMSKSLRAQAQITSDAAQRGELLRRSQASLDAFVRNNPNHPEALQAQITSAEMLFDHAQETIAGARTIKDKAAMARALLQARGELSQVKSSLQPSVDKLIEQIRGLGAPPTKIVRGQVIPLDRSYWTRKQKDTEARRTELKFDLIRASGELALVDYFRSQTYDPVAEAADRKLALNTSAKLLDTYYQQHRSDDPMSELGRSGFIGALVAHTWYGKAVEDLNDLPQAKDVFDEVLENFPDPPESDSHRGAAGKSKEEKSGLEPILARAKFYSLQLLAHDPKQQKQFMDQAQQFLSDYKSTFHEEWGYQATSLEVAKRLLTAIDAETDPKAKAELTKTALGILKDMTAVPSEFQADAATLIQRLGSGGVTPGSVDEAMGFIRVALDEKKWEQAESLCRTAIDLLNKQTKRDASYTDLMGKLQDTIAECQVQPIFEDFAKNREPFKAAKYKAWMDAGFKAAQENKKSVIAPKAAAFSVYCAAVLYGKARSDSQDARTPAAKKAAAAERADAERQLKDTTDFLLANFPNSSEADEARLSLAKAKWSDGDVADAIATFESINPKSEKYPEALRLAGELHVEQFQDELRKPTDKQDKKLTEKFRTEAIAALTLSVREQMSLLHPGDPIPDELIKTQLLLAQVHMEGKEYTEAVQVLQPLIDAAYAAKKSTLDETMLKIFSSAVRAYMAMNDFKRAGAAGIVLIDLGPDKREVNGVLVDFVRRLDLELKDLRAQLKKLADAPPSETEGLRARVSSVKEMMSSMVSKLAQRKELDAKSMVYLGSLFTDVDDYDSAKDQYRKVSDSPEVDEKLRLWVGAQLVDLLGKEGKLDEATAQIAKLRQQRPNNLDFMKVEAQLWQEWGEKDATRYDTAAEKWTEIRRRLQRQKAKVGSIYYDAVYNASFCLFMEANKLALDPSRHADAVRKADDAEKILKSELIPNPNLNGPATVKQFKDLLSDVQKVIQRMRPAATALEASPGQ